MEDRPRPLYVPDLSRPAGADVDAQGHVRCVACGASVDVTTADIVGKGYRCARCSALATPEDDADASLSPSEQAHVPDPPRASRLVLAGVAFVVLGALMWVTGFDIDLGTGHYHRSLFVYIFVAAIGCFAVALSRPRKWR
jgi:predicted anti-sigma-YlaC factor YlaD